MISFCQDIHISYEYHYQVQSPNTTKKPSTSSKIEINSANCLQKVKKYKLQVLSKRQNSPRSQSEKQFIGIQITNPNKSIKNHCMIQKALTIQNMKSDKTINNLNQFPQKSQNIVLHSPTTSRNIQTIRAKHRRTGSHEVGIIHQQISFNMSKISEKKTYNFFNQPTIKKPQVTNSKQKNDQQSTQLIDLQRSNETKVIKKFARPLQLNRRDKQFLKTVEIESDYENMNDLETPGKNKKFMRLKNINQINSIDNKQTLKLPIEKRSNKNNNFRSSILNDAVSIVSKNFQEQSFSMVQPGQYFFCESEILNRDSDFKIIKKSLSQKTYTLGIAVETSIEVICSLKQFSKENQKYYLEEVQIYSNLKKQDAIDQILNLYQLLPNSKDKKLLLIKEPYTNSLQTYLKMNHIEKKQVLTQRIMSQIKRGVNRLNNLGLYIKEGQSFQLQDFVQIFGNIKIQNLLKFQRVNLHHNIQKSSQRSKTSQIKLDILEMKIKRQLPSILKI